jgi:hypothetical protein
MRRKLIEMITRYVTIACATLLAFAGAARGTDPNSDAAGATSDDSGNRSFLENAKKATRTSSGYHVEVFGSSDAGSIRVFGDVAGDDFDLIPSQSLRLRCVRGKYWKSSDGGGTWQPTARDRAAYNLVTSFIVGYQPKNSRIEVVEKKTLASGILIWLELSPDPPPASLDTRLLPRFAIAKLGDGRTLLQGYKGAVLWSGNVTFVDVAYTKIGAVDKIVAPQ